MKLNSILIAIGMVMSIIFVTLAFLMTRAEAGGPWSDQYCNATVETVIVKNDQGEVIDKQTIRMKKLESRQKKWLNLQQV